MLPSKTLLRTGIGLLSKHKIISQEVKHLCYHRGPDTNQRVILHAQLDYNAQVINVIVVHMSYDRTRQCGNAEEILNYIEGKDSLLFRSRCSFRLVFSLHFQWKS